MSRPRPMSVVALVLACWLAPPVRSSPVQGAESGSRIDDRSVQDMVAWDRELRESLVAIDDWETVLERLEGEGREVDPILPSPTDGRGVAWPCPLPRPFVPPRDRGLGVSLAARDGSVVATLRRPGAPATVLRGPSREPLEVYRHVGGGGKDHWYHAFHRRHDRLCRVRVVDAPFALSAPSFLGAGLGAGQLEVRLRSAVDREQELHLRLEHIEARRPDRDGTRVVRVAPGEEVAVRWPLALRGPGGGLLVLTIRGDDATWRVPWLTHVEDVPTVLEGVRKLLRDHPSPELELRLEALEAETARRLGAARAPHPPDLAEAWRGLFAAASTLRDQALLARVDFDALLFLTRKPFDSEQPFMDAHHLRNRPGGRVVRLSPVRPGGRIRTVVDGLGEGVYRDLRLHWRADRFLFAFGNGSDRWDGGPSYHIWEAGVDGGGARQLTRGPRNDCEPFYLADGGIGFTSDRSDHFVMCGGDRHSPNLYVADGDGGAIRRISHNVFNDFQPTLLPDGRILYGRWEYNERSVTSLHNPFTMRPDGTMVAPFYGNATIRPNVVMFPRPVPDSGQVIALFTAHHGQTHGAIGLIDSRRGVDGPGPVTLLTPGVPVTGEKIEDSRRGWYSDPVALSEDTYLCSFTPTVVPWHEDTWAIYVGDRHGNLALIHREPDISCAEPVPLVRRAPPFPVARVAAGSPDGGGGEDGEAPEATLLLIDVGIGLDGVDRGEARHLRVLEDVPRAGVTRGGVITTAATSIYTVKRVLGTVPVEADGSAHFRVPADRNVYFEVLDSGGREIQRMRSVVCLRPGEVRTCIGCHEPRTTAPPTGTVPLAARRSPDAPEPPPWGTRTVSYLRDVQPLVEARCVSCHAYDRPRCRVILTDDLTDRFCISYEELVPYLSTANAMRWDHPDDVRYRAPRTYGSRVSPLARLLDAGHHGVRLSAEEWERLAAWIDANGVYHDRYETWWPDRRIFTGQVRARLGEVWRRRCAPCHGEGDGRQSTWWLSIAWRDATESRMLQAPLARAAGGWGRCSPAVFATTRDPDYRRLLGGLEALLGALGERPRADLRSLGEEIGTRARELPPPPPPRPPPPPVGDPGEVFLGDLEWVEGKSGWSPDGDPSPRVDRDIEGRRVMVGGRAYRRGLGTHAPSRIVYRLDPEAWGRLRAIVGAPEAGGSVVFRVVGDGRTLLETEILRGPQATRQVDVDVRGVERLEMVVTDAGDGYHCDSATWAAARLRPAGLPVNPAQETSP